MSERKNSLERNTNQTNDSKNHGTDLQNPRKKFLSICSRIPRKTEQQSSTKFLPTFCQAQEQNKQFQKECNRVSELSNPIRNGLNEVYSGRIWRAKKTKQIIEISNKYQSVKNLSFWDRDSPINKLTNPEEINE